MQSVRDQEQAMLFDKYSAMRPIQPTVSTSSQSSHQHNNNNNNNGDFRDGLFGGKTMDEKKKKDLIGKLNNDVKEKYSSAKRTFL